MLPQPETNPIWKTVDWIIEIWP